MENLQEVYNFELDNNEICKTTGIWPNIRFKIAN